MAKNYDDIGGVWRTIGGRKVFIKDGQSLEDAMKESGKFKRQTKQQELWEIQKQHKGPGHKDYDEKLKELNELQKEENEAEEYELYKKAKEKPESIDPMTENSTDWEALDRKYRDRYEKEQRGIKTEYKKEKNNWKEQIEKNNAQMEKDVTNLQNQINDYRNKSIEYKDKDALKSYQYLKEADKLQDKYYERFRENERANAKIKVEEPNEKYMNVDAYAGYKEKFNKTWGEDGSSDKVVSAKMYTNDEFMEHLEDANWHSERRALLDANLTNKELEYIKDRTKVSAWGVDNLTGKEQVDKLIKEAKSQNNSINNSLRQKAYQKYLKEHPNSKMTFEEFKDMKK